MSKKNEHIRKQPEKKIIKEDFQKEYTHNKPRPEGSPPSSGSLFPDKPTSNQSTETTTTQNNDD